MLISNSSDNYSYKFQLLTQADYETLNSSDAKWRHYLRDHRQLIKEHSTKVAIKESQMLTTRYRPRKFLTLNESSEHLETAFKIVNRIKDNMSFNEKNYDFVYIPDLNYITELWKMFSILEARYAAL